MITVIIADDDALIRRTLEAGLHGLRAVKVVGEAADGPAVVQLAESLRPTVVLMDVHMPKLNGIQATRLIRCLSPDTVVVGMSADITHDIRTDILTAGARAFIRKEALTPDGLRTVIQEVLDTD